MPRAREVVMIAAVVLLAACGANTQPPPPSAERATSAPHVVLPDGFVVQVEVASDTDTRATGLMYRPSLPPDRGMLFLFPETSTHGFWMKNTLIPLDMIWIDEGGRVVHVEANVPPCEVDPCPSYAPEIESRHVLELGGGEAAKHGVVPGARIEIRNTGQYIAR